MNPGLPTRYICIAHRPRQAEGEGEKQSFLLVIWRISHVATRTVPNNFQRKTTQNAVEWIKYPMEWVKECLHHTYGCDMTFSRIEYLSRTIVSIISRMFKQFFYSVSFLFVFFCSSMLKNVGEKKSTISLSLSLSLSFASSFCLLIPRRFACTIFAFVTVPLFHLRCDICGENTECKKRIYASKTKYLSWNGMKRWKFYEYPRENKIDME